MFVFVKNKGEWWAFSFVSCKTCIIYLYLWKTKVSGEHSPLFLVKLPSYICFYQIQRWMVMASALTGKEEHGPVHVSMSYQYLINILLISYQYLINISSISYQFLIILFININIKIVSISYQYQYLMLVFHVLYLMLVCILWKTKTSASAGNEEQGPVPNCPMFSVYCGCSP